jgi:DNA invertase Pin-like site-specific DNA recombinase
MDYVKENKMFKTAFAYLRTSSATNVGPDKDSDKRQLAAIQAFADQNKIMIKGTYYDAGVRGSDPIQQRTNFNPMLWEAQRLGIELILVESPDRFARDLIVQLTGHSLLKQKGIQLVPTTAPDYFTHDTPTAVMVRQILGAVAEFDKSTMVAKLKSARDRKSAELGRRVEGRRANPKAIEAAERIVANDPTIGLRQLSRQLKIEGFLAPNGKPYSTSSAKLIRLRAMRKTAA